MSGEQLDIEGKDAAAVGERRIYQNSSKFRDLETSGKLIEPVMTDFDLTIFN